MSETLPGFPALPSNAETLVVSEPELVAIRLSELHPSLDEALLREANEHGYRARLEATDLHAPTAAGSYHWHDTLFAIRFALTERDWVHENLRNCPFIVSPDRKVAIAVMTGDADTGLVKGNPTNQAQKGAVLQRAVAQNQQLELFDPAVAKDLANSKDATQLWILLYHVAIGTDGKPELRAELSLPSRFARKKIVGWTERIVLAAIHPDGEPVMGQDEPTGPIDVPVQRRTGTS
ncbi:MULTISPECIES: hypothetical protein [Burkholderia]|uniref:hypothetical protein n=1 Tax=Burkholderia TaxID=32008 RepID=UPI00110E1CC5|nr:MULTISPECIES: hypothetical protein [Burkholderia]MBR8179420.1 hypothetical protein [Burkholderia ambifaria]QDW48865.1 hypothetical protein FFI87_000020 [Burkholderia sp. KBS0801]